MASVTAELTAALTEALPADWTEFWHETGNEDARDGFREFTFDNAAFAAAILAHPAMQRIAAQAELGAAWEECEAAKPEGWRFSSLWQTDTEYRFVMAGRVEDTCDHGYNHGGSRTMAGEGPTPAAALRALAAKLREGGRE